VFLTALLLGAYFHYPALSDYYVIHDDVRQSLNWISYGEPAVFSDSIMVSYAEVNRTPLLNFIYKAGAQFVDPLWLGKIYALLFYAFSMTVFYMVGLQLAGPICAALAFCFFAFTYQYFHFASGGFSHALMMPFMALTIWGIYRQNWKFFLFLLPLEVLSNPMAGVTTGFALVFDILGHDLKILHRSSFWKAKGNVLLLAATLSATILISKYQYTPEWYGHLVSKAEASGRLELTAQGRYRVLPVKSLIHEIKDEIGPFVLCSLALFIIGLRTKILTIPRGIWQMLLSGLFCFSLADLFYLKLYFPNRYIEYCLPVVLVFFLAHHYSSLLKAVTSWPKTFAAVLLIVLISCTLEKPDLQPGINTRKIKRPEFFTFLKTLPTEALLAAPPNTADNIPVFARRRVLVNYELAHPWVTNYWKTISARTSDFFTAYFAEDQQTVQQISEKYGITHWVIRPSYFERKNRNSQNFYFEPFNSAIIKDIQGRETFFFQEACQDSFIYQDDKYCVLATDSLFQ